MLGWPGEELRSAAVSLGSGGMAERIAPDRASLKRRLTQPSCRVAQRFARVRSEVCPLEEGDVRGER